MGNLNVKKMEVERDVEGLLKALKDKDWAVRVTAARSLGEIADERAVEPLIQALKGEEIWEEAEEALAKISTGREDIKKGECPICGTKYNFWVGRKLRCYFCGVDLTVEQDRLVEESFEEVTKSPKYQFVIPHLHDIWINLELPMCCCICLKPVGMSSDFQEISTSEFARGGMELVTYKLKIPYCKDCRRKVKRLFGRREKLGVSIEPELSFTKPKLNFRNPLYARMVRQANKERIREARSIREATRGL